MRKGKKGKGQKGWEKTPPPETNFWLRPGVSRRTHLFFGDQTAQALFPSATGQTSLQAAQRGK